MPLYNTCNQCGNSGTVTNFCGMQIHLEPCTAAQFRQNNIALQALITKACEEQNACEEICFKQQFINFSGIRAEVTVNTLPADTAGVNVYWNGVLLAEGEDYTISGGFITFTEEKEDCTIIVTFKACPDPVTTSC